jgi:hypothetical protein
MQIYFAFILRLAIIRLSTNNGDKIMSKTIWDCIKAAGKDEIDEAGKITRIASTKNGQIFLGLEVFSPVEVGNIFFVFMRPGVYPLAVARQIPDVINAEIEIEILGELRSMYGTDNHVFTPLIDNSDTLSCIDFDCEVYRAHDDAVVFG